MNLNAVDNLLYKRKNVLAYLLSPDVQIFAGGWGGGGRRGAGGILGRQDGNLQPQLQLRKRLFIPGH